MLRLIFFSKNEKLHAGLFDFKRQNTLKTFVTMVHINPLKNGSECEEVFGSCP
jgi:hypothetical protein